MAKKPLKTEILKRRIMLAKIGAAAFGAVFVASAGLLLIPGAAATANAAATGLEGMTGFASKGIALATHTLADSQALVKIGVMIISGAAIAGLTIIANQRQTELEDEQEKIRKNTQPSNQLVPQFFETITSWVMESQSPTVAHQTLDEIRRANTKSDHALAHLQLKLTEDSSSIQVKYNKDPNWNDVESVFSTYFNELGVDKEKFLHIAEYLKRDELVFAMQRLYPKAPEVEKAQK